MSLVRLLPAWLHAIADYAVAITLLVLALAVHATGKAMAAGVVIGAVVLVVSMLTRYPLGVIKVLPFTVHSAGDYLAAVLLVASPFALGFTSSDTALSVVYVAAGIAVLGVSLITNYQYGPQSKPATARKNDRSDADEWFTSAAQQRQVAPSYASQAVGDESWRTVETVSESWRNETPASAPTAPASTVSTGARSLREVLAERAAGSAA